MNIALRYFSTFSGIGGFELGILKAYEADRQKEARKYSSSKSDLQNLEVGTREWEYPVCVGYSEIDKYACQVYSKHFPEHQSYGDIKKISAESLPDFDLICGGFPCQAFSIAGKRGGFDDTRGTLFFDLARIIKAKKPALLFFENVKGLLSHDRGRTFDTIIRTLDELGYDIQWQVLNSKNFGVPQNRERVFIIGHLRGTPRPKVFPFIDYGKAPDDIQGQVANTLTTRYEASSTGTYVIENKLDAQKIGTLRTHKDGQGFRELKEGISPTIPARAREDGSGQPVISKDAKIRRLTPKECERLQSFPDEWTSGQSDSQRYKMLGNAVTVNVIEAIASKLLFSGDK